jgi:hypothetical protein
LPAEPTQPLISLTVWNNTDTTLKVIEESAVVAPLRLTQPAGPRPPPSKKQEAIAVAMIAPSPTQHSIRLVKPQPQPQPSTPHESPKLPPISQSELGGESMRQFFSQIGYTDKPLPPINHLASSSMSRKGKSTPLPEEDDERFADAEEDHTSSDGASLYSSIMTTPTNPSQSGGSSPGIPGSPGFGLGILTQNAQNLRFNHASRPILPRGLPRPGEVLQGAASTRRTSAPAKATPPLHSPIRPISQPMNRAEGASSDKENTALSTPIRGRPRAGTIGPHSSAAAKGSTLERRRTLGDRHVQIVLPGEEIKLRKKHSVSSESKDSIIL